MRGPGRPLDNAKGDLPVNWTKRGVIVSFCAATSRRCSRAAAIVVACLAGLAPAAAHAQTASQPPYTLKGDLAEIKSKGTLRFLFHGEADHLPRAEDPRAAERGLAEAVAQRLGLTA